MFFLPAVHQSGRVNWILTAVLMNKVSKVDEKVCCLRHSMIWPGGEVELAHCVALRCVGLEEYTLKIKENLLQRSNSRASCHMYWTKLSFVKDVR